MNLKIECACGQKIAFEVEPENGAMPCELPCPSCEADVTGVANAEIQRQSAVLPVNAAAAPQLRIPVAASEPAPASVVVAEAPRPARPVAMAMAAAAAAAPVRDDGDGEASIGSFLLGTVGIFAGTLAGILVWYLIAKTGLTLRLLAILVGVGAGAGARFFCRGGDKGLGAVAAVVAVVAMFFGGAITLNKSVVEKFSLSDKELRESYDDEVKTAKTIATQIPGGTDEEIRRYLAKGQGGAAEVTAEDVADFRSSDEFKQAKDLASGKVSFESYAQNYRKEFTGVTKDASKVVGAVGAIRMLSIWLIALVGGTAYKLAAG